MNRSHPMLILLGDEVRRYEKFRTVESYRHASAREANRSAYHWRS